MSLIKIGHSALWGGETLRESSEVLFLPGFFQRKIPHGQVCGGFSRGTPLERSGNTPDRYSLFFAKLFFLPKNPHGQVGGGFSRGTPLE